MSAKILSPAEVGMARSRAYTGHGTPNETISLADSHEALRAERDEARAEADAMRRGIALLHGEDEELFAKLEALLPASRK